jgi:hypothetical protein
MSANLNWAQLYNQGRVKAIGVPWSDEDREALNNGVSVEDVRNGILKKEDKDTKEKKMTSLEKMKREELILLAKEKGISVDEKIVSKGDLILLLKAEDEKEPEKNTRVKYQDFLKEYMVTHKGATMKDAGVAWKEYKKVN